MAGRIRPECRSCGERVECFGDYCSSCEPGEDFDDGLVALTNDDLARLSARVDA